MAKILLVEDDKSLREIYGVRLLAEGYDIVSAGDGEEALAMAIKERPHLIVSDVMMPKISGFDMLDILRSTSETKDIKVIMMTALSSEDQRQRGEQLGADRYLVKSQVGIEDVVRTVHEVLGDIPGVNKSNDFSSASQPPAPAQAQPAAPAPEPAASPQPQPSAPAPSPAPAPEPAQRPASPTVPPRPSQEEITAPVAQPQQAAPAPAQAQPSAPAPEPAASPQPQPSAPANQPTNEPSLPQPTAPFSTNRPAGLADRIIQPLEHSGNDTDQLASQMEKELNGNQDALGTSLAAAQAEEPQSNDNSTTAQDTSPPAQAPTPPANEQHGIEFEETPRPPADQTPQTPQQQQ